MRIGRIHSLGLLAATTVCATWGCSSESASDASSQDEIQAVPFSSTIELKADDLSSLAPDPGDGTLVFATTPASLASVRVGNILVGGLSPSSPAGLLRAVLDVQHDGDRLILKTGQAPIQLAYKKLHARFVRQTPVQSDA